MIRVLCLMMLTAPLLGNDLLVRLHTDLNEDGETAFTPIEIALIAEGVDSESELKEHAAAWASFVAELVVPERKRGQSGKRKFKTVKKAIGKKLLNPVNDETGFIALMDEGTYNRLSVSWLYARVGTDSGLVSEDYQPLIGDVLDPWFFRGETPDAKRMAAAWLAYQAYHRPDDAAEEMAMLLEVGNMLVPEHAYEQETLGKLLYNRTLELHNAGNQVTAAKVGIASAMTYPGLDLYQPVLFNTGIKLITGEVEQENPALVTELCNRIAPLTGQYEDQFRETLDNRAYNTAAKLYNAGEYAAAMTAFESLSNPPDTEEYRSVLSSTYVLLIEQAFEKGEKEGVPALMTKLEKLNPDQYEVMRQRLNQLELIELDKRGDLGSALEMAASQIESDIDQKNYLSILIRFNQAKRSGENFDEALELLDGAIVTDWSAETVNRLRFDTYFDWLETFEEEDWQGQLPIFRKVFADEKLDMSGENGDVMRHNYGNVLYKEISKHIEERDFEGADKKSKAALKILPEHPQLKEQRDLIDRIMKRLGQ